MGITPTTKAQVSGHKFLLRRMEHGLVLGDIRMIHDPFAKRQRALVFGLAVCALIAIGAVALAIFKPAADPGAAKIIQSDNGQLYVRVEDVIHPAANLVSARLVVGEPATPQPVSEIILRDLPKAQAIGIIDAPGIFSTPDSEAELTAYVCHDTTIIDRDKQPIVVVIQEKDYPVLPSGQAVVAIADGAEWLVMANGRRKLPSSDTPDGRLLRRQLGIDVATPRWLVPPQVLSAVTELPEVGIPPEVTEVIHVDNLTGGHYWARTVSGVVAVSVAQAELLINAGRPLVSATAAEINEMPDDVQNQLIALPEFIPKWQNPADRALCISNTGVVVSIDPQWNPLVPVAATGAVATHFSGPGWTIGAETGSGVHVISDTGVRHQVANSDVINTIGLHKLHLINWDILRLLPEGTTLERARALQPLVQ